MWREIFTIVTFTTSVLSLSLSGPFLFRNAPAALTDLATSASASASNPSQPLTHIADLRKKQDKAEQLQSEKLLSEDDENTDDLSMEGPGDNEASPTLLQKKIGKILKKIRFLSSLSRGSGTNGGNGNGDGSGTDLDSSTATISTTTEGNLTTNDTLNTFDNDVQTSEEITTKSTYTFQKIIYPHSKYDTPYKVSFDVNEKMVNEPETEDVVQESQNVQKVEDTGRLSQIGIFFAELVGSLVGLIYGAAAHITSTNGSEHLE